MPRPHLETRKMLMWCALNEGGVAADGRGRSGKQEEVTTHGKSCFVPSSSPSVELLISLVHLSGSVCKCIFV